MNKTIRGAMVGLIALLCGGAFADGVSLITPGAAISARDPVLTSAVTKTSDFVKVHPIAVNKAALGSPVLTVMVDGVSHTFVGGVVPEPMRPSGAPTQTSVYVRWSGVEKINGNPSGVLALLKDVKTGEVSGVLDLAGRNFAIASGVMIERDARRMAPVQYIEPPAPPAPPASGSKTEAPGSRP